MASFNMDEFNDILEKCKDQSNQEKQDEVNLAEEPINFFKNKNKYCNSSK